MAKPQAQDIEVFYKEILKSNGILATVSEVKNSPPDTTADGFMSDTEWITVKFENANLKPMHLFAKKMIDGVQGSYSFEKENVFLTKYVPAVKELLHRKGIDEKIVTDIYPQCYYGNDTIIVLQDIVREKGYETLGKDEVHDFDTAVVALQTLARHHAIGYAMVVEEGGPEKFFQKFPYLDFESTANLEWLGSFEPWMQSAVKANYKVLELNINLDGVPQAITRLQKLCAREPSICRLLAMPLNKTKNQLEFLNHGDYHYCNMMFRKDPASGKIIGHKAFDFQMVHYNCPSLDLSYYLFSSVKTAVRQHRLKELFEIYLFILNKFSADLGHPTNLAFETLFMQYRKRMQYGLVHSFFFQYGPGVEILKEVDMKNLDSKEQGATVDRLSSEWIEKNPDKAKQLAEGLVKVLQEFNDLEIK